MYPLRSTFEYYIRQAEPPMDESSSAAHCKRRFKHAGALCSAAPSRQRRRSSLRSCPTLVPAFKRSFLGYSPPPNPLSPLQVLLRHFTERLYHVSPYWYSQVLSYNYWDMFLVLLKLLLGKHLNIIFKKWKQRSFLVPVSHFDNRCVKRDIKTLSSLI